MLALHRPYKSSQNPLSLSVLQIRTYTTLVTLTTLIALPYIALHCITLRCIALHRITLHAYIQIHIGMLYIYTVFAHIPAKGTPVKTQECKPLNPKP